MKACLKKCIYTIALFIQYIFDNKLANILLLSNVSILIFYNYKFCISKKAIPYLNFH